MQKVERASQKQDRNAKNRKPDVKREKKGNQRPACSNKSTLPNNQKMKKEQNYPDLKQNNGYIFQKKKQGRQRAYLALRLANASGL